MYTQGREGHFGFLFKVLLYKLEIFSFYFCNFLKTLKGKECKSIKIILEIIAILTGRRLSIFFFLCGVFNSVFLNTGQEICTSAVAESSLCLFHLRYLCLPRICSSKRNFKCIVRLWGLYSLTTSNYFRIFIC